MKKKDALFLGIGAVAIIASAAVVGFAVMNTNSDDTSASTSSASVTKSSASSSTDDTSSSSSSDDSASTSSDSSSSDGSASSSSYKDGTYSATVIYSVPKGDTNSITASVTISGGEITAVTSDNSYTDHESGQYISRFESSLSSSATGQSLADYSPSRIGGASLTTSAFADVLDQIRQDAAA